MFSFRQKIFITYVLVFAVFIALIFPFSTYFVNRIVSKAMVDRADDLLQKIQSAPTNEALVRRLKDEKSTVFFRVSVITDQKQVLFDSHTKRLLGPKFSQEYVVEHPEVIKAFKEGIAFNIDYSDLLGQKFYYMAKAFDFQGKRYVIRTAVPYNYVDALATDFKLGFVALMAAVLFFFSIMTWIIINHLTRPINQIIDAIGPYQQGKVERVPEIRLSVRSSDEFTQLAQTLNSLSLRVQNQISTLTQERNEKEAILESLIEGVVAVDNNLTITYANEMAQKMLGKAAEKIVDHPFDSALQPTCHDLLMHCQEQDKVLTDTLQLRKEGRKTFLDIVAAPKGKQEGAILVLQDQTTHYQMMEMRKDFIANASHELKTPITIIRGFAETLHDNPTLPLDTVADITTKIVRNCNRMTALIKDLLALADIENLPSSRLIDCDLYDLLQHCKQTLATVFPDAQVTIQNKTTDEAHMVGDPNLLELAFMNLIENAAKYSTPPANITITLEKSGKWVFLTIADKGIGIPNTELDKIFQRFHTVDKARSQRMGGSGLGLSIVETIIHKHFGTISVRSTVGVGSTFVVKLPTNLEATT